MNKNHVPCSRMSEQDTALQRAKDSQKKDKEKILQLQTDYLFLREWGMHNNSQTETDFIKSLQNVAKKYIFYEQKKRGFFISTDEVEFKSFDAVIYIMEQFKKRPDFSLKEPSQYVRLRVLAELYRHKKIEEYTRYTDMEIDYYGR